MRVFVAGATGAIGAPLLALLVAEGHEVTGMTRSPERAAAVRAAGAEAAIADALDAEAVAGAVRQARPETIVHQLTAIPRRLDPRKIVRDFAMTDRLRTEGTRNLVAAAQAVGGARVIAQSIAFAYEPGPAGTVHVESDPLTSDPPAPFKRSAQAVAELERTVLGAGGLVLRYGYFYGPGTSISRRGSLGEEVAKRRLPIVGGGGGVWSFIHVEDAARATAAALTQGASAAYNVVDDEPAPVHEWVPALAQALGAKPPRRVPAWLARPLAGEYGVYTMTRAQGASNARAKQALGWTPGHAGWREGFRDALG
ncbi:MAG TPA: NAD(P)-dependent oxidoreductase [Solirubrobacteraceae bacterium]|jgi:nucleoside-diphosphate-sugar epimerase|nr:NAD(P)-dependent oxidoreductase [Solirubrobacteraceae bacterium]